MLKKSIFMLITGFLLCAPSAWAQSLDTGWDTIRRVTHWSSGIVEIWLENSQHSCSDPNNKTRYYLHDVTITDVKEFDQKYALSMSAKFSGSQINMRYTCYSNGRPHIRVVRVQ